MKTALWKKLGSVQHRALLKLTILVGHLLYDYVLDSWCLASIIRGLEEIEDVSRCLKARFRGARSDAGATRWHRWAAL